MPVLLLHRRLRGQKQLASSAEVIRSGCSYCHRQADFILLPRFTQNSKRRRRSQIPAQGWSVRQPWGDTDNNPSTLKAFAKDRAFANTFSVEELYFLLTQGCSNPWAQICELRWSFTSGESLYRRTATVTSTQLQFMWETDQR
jgi:hypothetical protein